MTIKEIETSFNNPQLFEQALTHRSWINENPGVRGTNERLEFLGDAILEYIVSEFIYNLLPDKEEGFLTALRANIVNTKNLASVAKKLKIGSRLHVSLGVENNQGRDNPSLLADTIESIIGAIFIDQGMDATKKFIQENILADIDVKLEKPLKDPKSRLQEAVQAKGLMAPKYKVVDELGPDHEKQFIVEVFVDGTSYGKGEGSSKLKAETAAAESALVNFENN